YNNHRDTENTEVAQRRQKMIRLLISLIGLFGTAIIFTVWPSSASMQTPPVKVEGCVGCHGLIEPMHKYGPTETLEKIKDGKDAVGLSCTACHGGNPASKNKDEAHVKPMFPREWRREGKYSGANPERSNTLLARESWEFVRFINPGALRVVGKTCAGSACHEVESKNVPRSMMTHGAMLWGAALYNNGSFHLK